MDEGAGTVRVQISGAVCSVTLDYPARLNAMSRSMWARLRLAFLEIQRQPSLRCVVLRGAGANFCAGGDIAEYPGFRFDPDRLRHFHEVEVWGALDAILACDVPVVAVIEGACMGAGVELAACCDIRLASDLARFGAPIARLGFPMAPREAALVSGALGPTVARAMLLAAEIYSADQLFSTGFLTRVVADAAIADTAKSWVERVIGLAPQAARSNKKILRQLLLQPLQSFEMENVYAFASQPEHREGIYAFLEKRRPEF